MPAAARPNTKFTRSDFSGGILEGLAVDEFTERQNAVIKGFVLESETEMRSQWACQSLTPAGDSLPLPVRDFRLLRTGAGATLLFAIDSGGGLWWTTAPGASVRQAAFSAEWTRLTGFKAGSRFICEVPYGANLAKYASGLLIQPPVHYSDGEAHDSAIVYLGDNDVPLVARYSNGFPSSTLSGSVSVPNTGVMPWSKVGAMWGSYLVLGNVLGSSDGKPANFAEGHARKYTNGLWISATPTTSADPFRVDQWSNVYGFMTVGTPETRVVGLLPIDVGLLVFTTSASEGDGLLLLRGSPPGLSLSTTSATFKLEPVRGGLAAPVVGDGENKVLAQWPEGGTTVLMDSRASVWTTNGSQVGQLDRYGPRPPAAVSATDGVAAFGQYLVMARSGRLFALRLFGQEGAWTELVHPTPGISPTCLQADGGSLWFLASGAVWRYSTAVADDRGMMASSTVELSLATATVGPDEYDTTLWHRVGVAVSGTGTLLRVRTLAGPALAASSAGFTVQVNRKLGARGEIVVPAGIGRAAEASAVVTVTGDVRVESVRFESVSKAPKRG
jgi:hypothetical protein